MPSASPRSVSSDTTKPQNDLVSSVPPVQVDTLRTPLAPIPIPVNSIYNATSPAQVNQGDDIYTSDAPVELVSKRIRKNSEKVKGNQKQEKEKQKKKEQEQARKVKEFSIQSGKRVLQNIATNGNGRV